MCRQRSVNPPGSGQPHHLYDFIVNIYNICLFKTQTAAFRTTPVYSIIGVPVAVSTVLAYTCYRCSSPLDQPTKGQQSLAPSNDVSLSNKILIFNDNFEHDDVMINHKIFKILGNLDNSVPIHVSLRIPLGNSPLRCLSLWVLWALWAGGPGEQTYCDTMICIPVVPQKAVAEASEIGNL